MNFDFENYVREKFAEVVLHREQMHGYQFTGLDFLKANPFSALFIDMGLGKTVTSATLIADILGEFANDDKVLIIGPLRVATQTWPDEFRKWSHLAHLNLSIVHVDDADPRIKAAGARAREASRARRDLQPEQRAAGTRAEAGMRERIRVEAAHSTASVHVISRDWVEWLVDHYRDKWPYRTVIIDESSGFKDHKTGRFLAMQRVRDYEDHGPALITRLHLLTATPAAETYEHLWAQMYLLDRGTRLSKDIGIFRKRYMTENRYTRKWELRPDGEKDILAKITDICLVMKEEDYLPRVEPLFVERKVHMTEAQMKLYLTMAEDMVVTLDDGSTVKADSAAALSAKLLQMASGVLYETYMTPGENPDDDHVKIKKIHNIHTHKIDELRQIVEESQGKPILVGFHHRASKERLLREFPQATLMDREGKCVKKWQKGKIPMLLMHPQSGGHGLNLQAGGHIIVFYDIPWSLELYLQFIGRLSRQGQKHRVTVFLLVCQGTLDRLVVNSLAGKQDAQNFLFIVLKKMRAKLKALLKGRAKLPAEQWDEAVSILTDYDTAIPDDDDAPGPACCPNCGDAGGPCGPGSDCYDEL